jgi:hypothetical protein
MEVNPLSEILQAQGFSLSLFTKARCFSVILTVMGGWGIIVD